MLQVPSSLSPRWMAILRLLAILMIGALACELPPAHTPGSGEPSQASEPPALAPGEAAAIEIAGLPGSPTRWPDPVPTIWPDGALSIRALRLDAPALLAGSEAGEVVRVWAFVQGNEPREGEPLRTWIVDRAIDLGRLDQGMPVEPALPALPSGVRVELLARLEQRELAGIADPMLVLTPIAWTEPPAETWQQLGGEPRAAGERPAETEPSPLLRRAAEAGSASLADDLEGALAAIARAALADEGALAERHARRALQLDPNNVEVWSTLIALYHGYGHHDHHLAALLAASARGLVELDELWLAYGSLDVELGEFEHAIALLDHALALTPESLAANFYQASAHWLLGEHAAARSGYAKVVALENGRHAKVDAIEHRMIATAKARLAELAAHQTSSATR